MARSRFEKNTRRVFHAIHVEQGENPRIYRRLTSLLSTQYLRVRRDYFTGKVCLDAGCGSNANATYAMLRLGARRVHAFDLDDTVLKTAPKYLRQFPRRYKLSVNNVLHLHYPNNYFDFVHCAGVLHHSRDVFGGLKELARVTKVGGMLVFSVCGKGGLARQITNLLRDNYARDQEFRSLIDGLSEEHLVESSRWLFSAMRERGDHYADGISARTIRSLFDQDLVMTIKDRLQAPVYHETSPDELSTWLKGHGFTHVERLTRYPRYRNVRRFLSPLYHEYDHPLARLWYGSGFVQLRAVKGK